MKRLGTMLFALMAILSVKGQQTTTEEKKMFEPYGFIRNDVIMDSRKMVDSREGELMLYCKPAVIDANNKDINEVNQLKFLALTTRIGAKINGPDAFGAKTTGTIETDFYGVKDDVTRMLRVRHAYMKLDWGKPKLIIGQTWHMIVITECTPGVIGFGAAAPYHPLNRMPQIRLDLSIADPLTWSIAAGTYGYHNSAGPDNDGQRNSGLPDIHTQLKFKNDMIVAGATAGIKWLQPRLKTANNLKTEETLTGYDLQAFLKVTAGKVTFKTSGVFGQNLSMYTMLGGYSRDTVLSADDYSYVNIKSMAYWADFEIKPAKFITAGLFFGYSKILGTNDPVDPTTMTTTMWGRGLDLRNIMRLSPRVAFSSGKTELALEYSYDLAVYGSTWDNKLKTTDTQDAVNNTRILLSAKYAF